MELLTCKICDKRLPNLSGHIYQKHKLTGKEYKLKFGVDRIVSRECAQMMAEKSNEKWANFITRKKRTDGIRNSYTPELRKIRSESARNQFKDPNQRTIRRNIMVGKPMSKNTRKLLSESKTTNEWTKLRNVLYERAGSKCEICGISEEDLISQGKNRLTIHEKNYIQTIPKLEDCILCCHSCHKRLHNELHKSNTPQEENTRHIFRVVKDLLKTLKVDLLSDNFLETPRRFGSVLAEFSGMSIDFDFELEEICNSIFEHSGEGLIITKNIEVYGLCPHHLLPVKYNISLAYIPKGYAIGISKLTRLAEILAKKLQLQEHYTSQIADSLISYLKTPDVAVIVQGEHMCMRMRGVKDPHSKVIVSEMRGEFREDRSLRMETLALLELRNEVK